MGKIIKEYKRIHFEVKAVDDEQGLIEAYGSVFSNIDQGNDVVDKGSFKRTIKNSKARIDAKKANFLATMLWNHDTEHFLPIGGWYDLEEDDHGLLGKGQIVVETQLGRDVYMLIKKKVINEFSIGYEVMPGGSYYEKGTGVRHLTELRLWEISPVVWAMNQEALLVGVKNMNSETKSICGNTSGPIGPRDEKWDGSKAEGQIWDAAYDEDSDKIDTALAKKYFMVVDGDGSKKGDFSYPFWYVGDNPHICVGAVITIAKALAGSRDANPPDGLKDKVEKLYKRINTKYPNDNQLSLDDGKGHRMNRRQTKTLMEHYNEEMSEDLLEDLQDVYLCSLVKAIFDAFTIGDQPEQDVSQALDDFKTLMLEKFVAQAVECDLSQYLEDNCTAYIPSLNTMLNGSDDGYSYGYMSRSTRSQQRKAGRAISAATQDIIDQHVKAVKAMAKQAKADMQAHTDAMHDAVDGMAEYGSGKSLSTFVSRKAGRALSEINANALHDMADKAMSIMQEHTKGLTKAANGLAQAVKPPVSNTDGEDPMDDGDNQIEKSMQDALMELKALQTV